jgi:ribosomal protein L24
MLKIGDRVRVRQSSIHTELRGKTGTVLSINHLENDINVLIDGVRTNRSDGTYGFYAKNLELLNNYKLEEDI